MADVDVALAVTAGLPPRREDDSIVDADADADADAVVVVAINKTKRSARLQAEIAIILEFIILCVCSYSRLG